MSGNIYVTQYVAWKLITYIIIVIQLKLTINLSYTLIRLSLKQFINIEQPFNVVTVQCRVTLDYFIYCYVIYDA